MAKRFNVSIPDALAERLEPHKDKISLSAVMQAALERELAQLTMGDQEKQRRESFKRAALNAWLQRNPYHAKLIGDFVNHLIDEASSDGLPRIFDHYRWLYITCRRKELAHKISKNPRYFYFGMGAGSQEAIEEAMTMLQVAGEDEQKFWMDLGDFVNNQVNESDYKFMGHLLVRDDDDKTWLLSEEFQHAFYSGITLEVTLRMMEERFRSMLSDKEIESFVLDFESAFAYAENYGYDDTPSTPEAS